MMIKLKSVLSVFRVLKRPQFFAEVCERNKLHFGKILKESQSQARSQRRETQTSNEYSITSPQRLTQLMEHSLHKRLILMP